MVVGTDNADWQSDGSTAHMKATFANYPMGNLYRKPMGNKTGIVGIPIDLGATGQPGQRFAPDSIRAASEGYNKHEMIDPSTGYDFAKAKVVDWGDIDMVPGDYGQSLQEADYNLKLIYPHCKRLVVLGGDDGVNAAVVNSLCTYTQRPVTILHLDAHSDCYERIRGREDHGTWVRDVAMMDTIEAVVQYGVRAVTNTWADSRISRYAADWESVDTLVGHMLSVASKALGPVLLAVDMDVVDPAYAPGVAFPEPGGFTSREIRRIVREVAAVTYAMSITEVTPVYDKLGHTATLANRLVFDYIVGANAR